MRPSSILTDKPVNDLLCENGIEEEYYNTLSEAEKMQILMRHDEVFRQAVTAYKAKHTNVTDAEIYDRVFCDPFGSSIHFEGIDSKMTKILLWIVGTFLVLVGMLFIEDCFKILPYKGQNLCSLETWRQYGQELNTTDR